MKLEYYVMKVPIHCLLKLVCVSVCDCIHATLLNSLYCNLLLLFESLKKSCVCTTDDKWKSILLRIEKHTNKYIDFVQENCTSHER